MHRKAVFSSCKRYRYALWRIWDVSKPLALIIGLNPSIADAHADDPTVTRCIGFAKSWGYGGICMANLFAFRATDPKQMKLQKDPIGKANNKWLTNLASQSDIVIAAWGNDGGFKDRAKYVTNKLPKLHCIKLNKSGHPAHPLYLKRDLLPSPINIDNAIL